MVVREVKSVKGRQLWILSLLDLETNYGCTGALT
jgi:hypothetical protein